MIGGVPFLCGAIAVIFAVPIGAAAASFPKQEQPDWKNELAVRVRWLQQAFYALSIVLVTSTAALMLFFQLPVLIAVEPYRAEVLRFAHGMTLFWGATMTLKLIATFAPAMIALRQHAKQQHRTVAGNISFGEWFAEQVPITTRRQIANLTTIFAPILVGH